MLKNDSQEKNIINKEEIKVETNNKFIEEIKFLMEYIITQNNKNKELKISLYKIRGFDPNIIFNEIDNISTGYLNLKDFEDFFHKNDIKVERDIILLFIREYNKQEKDSNLYFHDFINFLKFDINKDEINLGEKDFDKDEINKIFLKLIESEFKLIKEKNGLINEIKKIKEFSTYEAFDIISNDKQYIDNESLNLFLGNKYEKNEIKELIYRLDLNNNGKISYEEFQDLFFPFQEHLHLEETNDEDIYKDEDEDKKYSVTIKNENYNLNIYKDNTFTQPKIIYTYNNEEKEGDNNENIIKNDLSLSNNSSNLNILNIDNILDNNKDDKYNSENLKIKYDENIIKEINENENEIGMNYIDDDYNINNHDYNNIQLEDKKNDIINVNDINVNINQNNFENKIDVNTINLNKDNKNNYNISNQASHENLNFKSDIDLLKNKENNIIYNNNLDNYEKDYSLNNCSKAENFQKNNNFSDIFSEKDKMIINPFIDYIHSITLLENRVENLRESISLCEDISLIYIFNKFDLNKNNLINKEIFKYVCNREYFLFPSENQINLLYKRYDLDNDNQLNFEEFMNIISPLKKEYLTLYEKDEDNTNIISFYSKKKIIELLNTIINTESSINELKCKLSSDKNFNFIDFWGLLMKYSQDDVKLNKNEFSFFLESFGCYLTNYELDIIFEKFAGGKNEIKYNDLYKEIIN